jgi:DNA-binding protein HU-beta
MSKAVLASVIAKATDASSTKAKLAADAVLAAIAKQLKTAGKFTLPGFGTFATQKLKARKARNPGTGAVIKVKASKTVRFKPSLSLRKII